MTRKTTVQQTYSLPSEDVRERFSLLRNQYRSESIPEICTNYWAYREKGPLFAKALAQLPVPSQHPYSALLGLEVETENVARKYKDDQTPAGWEAKGDGSLRLGTEFVSCVATEAEMHYLITSLYLFFVEQLKRKPNFSWRTSIHVHLNCRALNTDTLSNLLLLYPVFEMLLFNFADEQRKTSNFCVPIVESNYAYRMRRFVCSPSGAVKPIFVLADQWEKYSALNLSRLPDLGTVEFRHMCGTWDIVKLAQWIGLIGALYDASQRLEHNWVVQQIMGLNSLSNYTQFQHQIFGNTLSSLLGESESFNKLLSHGVSFAKQCLVKPSEECPPIHPNSLTASWIDSCITKIGNMGISKAPRKKRNLTPPQEMTFDGLTFVTTHGSVAQMSAAQIIANSVPVNTNIFDDIDSN